MVFQEKNSRTNACPEMFMGEKIAGKKGLVAFHPRPQIASDLGRNLTRTSNPHPKSQAMPQRERHFCLWPQTQIATGLNPPRFENRKPNPPLYLWCFELPKSQPAGRNRRIRAAKAAANHKIAGHNATKKKGCALLTFLARTVMVLRGWVSTKEACGARGGLLPTSLKSKAGPCPFCSRTALPSASSPSASSPSPSPAPEFGENSRRLCPP